MFEYNKFKHAAETNKVVIDNITTSENKRTILRSLQSNDRSYTKLQTSNYISDTYLKTYYSKLLFFIDGSIKINKREGYIIIIRLTNNYLCIATEICNRYNLRQFELPLLLKGTALIHTISRQIQYQNGVAL